MKRLANKVWRGVVTAVAAAAFIMMLSESEEGFVTWVNFAGMGVLWLCTLLLVDGNKDGKEKDKSKTERQ